ncbi:MAG: precorrin-4 C(11)-methyltransferase [Oscillatoriales cyanobacterium]|nr:MAG: precorrin-4 C(11)-methyltransferase [Oscillatoriales cyanobacterium]
MTSDVDPTLAIDPVAPLPESSLDRPATVRIVGAGPGDPDLISVRGQKLLATADTVFFAGSLVPAAMLTHCRPDVEVIDTRSLVLEDWLPIVIERAKAGRQVVRLQDGDPSLYGALHEVVTQLLEQDIPFEVVPGISAFQAAAARLAIELTVPNLVQSIILTRARGETQVPDAEDLASLAAHQASLCLYLSAHHAQRAQDQLAAHYPPEMTIALCYRIGWDDERVVLCRLDELATVTHREKLTRTVLYVISPALDAMTTATTARSRLYSTDHRHLFRPKASQP